MGQSFAEFFPSADILYLCCGAQRSFRYEIDVEELQSLELYKSRFHCRRHSTMTDAKSSSSFPFTELPETAQFHTLTYLAEAPYEHVAKDLSSDVSPSMGSLTTTLPLVCHKFRDYCRSDELWKASLLRAVTSDDIWRQAVLRLLPDLDLSTESPTTLEAKLLAATNLSTCKNAYQCIFSESIQVTHPVFFMPMDIQEMGPRYQLHFFEHRYRLMMASLMQGFEQVPGADGPVFLHVVDIRGPTARTAALVRVVECVFAQDGRALVELQVVGRVRICSCWVRPNSYSLYYARGYRNDSVDLTEDIAARFHVSYH
jgi:hypothetical protein